MSDDLATRRHYPLLTLDSCCVGETLLVMDQDAQGSKVSRALRLERVAAAWAYHRLLPTLLVLLTLLDVVLGLNWLLSDNDRLTSPGYMAAKTVAPMHTWGGVTIVYALVCVLVYRFHGRSFTAGVVIGLFTGGYWFFWAILFTSSAVAYRGVSWFPAIVAVALGLAHGLVGLALTHHSYPLVKVDQYIGPERRGHLPPEFRTLTYVGSERRSEMRG